MAVAIDASCIITPSHFAQIAVTQNNTKANFRMLHLFNPNRFPLWCLEDETRLKAMIFFLHCMIDYMKRIHKDNATLGTLGFVNGVT